MDLAAGQVEIANDLAGESGQALNAIMEFFDAATRQVQAIAAAGTQQSTVSGEINRALNEVDGVSTETAGAVGQTSRAIGELTGQIDTLSKLYGLFMLLGEGHGPEEGGRSGQDPGAGRAGCGRPARGPQAGGAGQPEPGDGLAHRRPGRSRPRSSPRPATRT